MDTIKKTPLNKAHHDLKAKMVDFVGWEMPINYPAGIISEHLTTRKFGGLFDISHMGRFRISGKDALPFLQYMLTNNAAALQPGKAQYSIIANENGGALDDTFLYMIDENEYLLVVNASNAEKDWTWLQQYKNKFPQATLEDQTTTVAMISLQGPRTKAILETVIEPNQRLPEPGRNNMALCRILNTTIPVARTGYTGEPICFELFPPAEIATQMWNRLLEVGEKDGIAPIGLGARDTLRLEANLPLYGHELGIDTDGKEIPILALKVGRFAVSFGEVKGEYIGREALLKQFQEITAREEDRLDTLKEKQLVPRVIMPMAISGNNIARAGYPVYVNDKPAGTVTSGTMVPYWKTEGTGVHMKLSNESGMRAICTAYLDADLKEGQKTQVAIRNRTAEAVIVERHAGSEAPPYIRPLLIKE